MAFTSDITTPNGSVFVLPFSHMYKTTALHAAADHAHSQGLNEKSIVRVYDSKTGKVVDSPYLRDVKTIGNGKARLEESDHKLKV